jgi:hypothetical protein
MMVTFITEIITNPLFPVVTLLLGFLIGHRLAIGRDRRKEFNAASDEFRKIFTQTLVDIQDENSFFGGYSIDTDSFKKLQVAYLNFRYLLKGAYRNQYDEAWDQYCFDCKYQSIFDDAAREKIAKDIKHILEFTEYRLLRSISFICGMVWWRIRFKFFGPDKETKILIEKISNHDEPPKKINTQQVNPADRQ